MSNKNWLRFIFISIAIFNIGDAVISWILISNGIGNELNYVPRLLMEQGPWAFFFVKIGVISGVLILAYYRLKDYIDTKFLWVFGIIAILMFLLVMWLTCLLLIFS